MLASVHRRRTLLTLRRDNPRGTGELADRDDRTTEIELVHVHLPRLEDAGYVDWDREDGTVTRGPQFAEIEPLLEVLVENRETLPATLE